MIHMYLKLAVLICTLSLFLNVRNYNHLHITYTIASIDTERGGGVRGETPDLHFLPLIILLFSIKYNEMCEKQDV